MTWLGSLRKWPILAACLGILAALAGCANEDPPENVNVVILLVDTLRADRLEPYGHDRPTSPGLASLAAKSVVFAQASSPAPWTLPSISSIMLSSFLCKHGVEIDQDRIPADASPMAEHFLRAGYSTAGFARNPYAGPLSGLDKGFQSFTTPRREFDRGLLREWLAREPQIPFFLYVHNIAPHNPWTATDAAVSQLGQLRPQAEKYVKGSYKSYRSLARTDWVAGRPIGTTDNTARQQKVMRTLTDLKPDIELLYDASIIDTDARITGLVGELDAQGLWDNTLLVVISDHGEELGDHGGWQHDQSLYQELVHIPWLIRFPGDRFGGRRVESPVSLVDLLPTLIDYLGFPKPEEPTGGRSLMPLIRGKSREERARVTAMRSNRKKYYAPYKEERGDLNVAVRKGRWKGIWNVEPATFELYDLSTDPAETNDLSSRQSDLVQEMHSVAAAELEQCRLGTGSGRFSKEGLDPATLEQLESLGYIDGN